ncbi:hypothetical protein CROQUDRAFT_649963 [Cronartium quercuum f. sp. fusiforme G11]|uniref:J domain-containing protein n=1 Tax=Cronartium quercuum f. sp. fusiforme G11 TaxID=708437 RepID=A0A9P6THW6_9BASI|nr:hypothetical protein CROQUDRAFT_649963 [Cronartium quercuum f. sp. fusiforme G11]
MDSNREEAQRAFKLAQSCETTDPVKALKFAKKACALYWSPEAAALVRTLENGEGSSKSTKNETESTKATSSSSRPSGAGKENLRSRTTPSTPKTTSSPTANGSPASTPSYKPAQLEIVKKVRRCKLTEYYEILDLKRDCEDGQIKTAYRKLALALHPDKNGAPGADEAFKMVSKAFQVLSDPGKRAAYDRHGADPDSRSAGVSSPFNRGHTHFAHADEGIDADQLFRMFFGGGMGGGMFDGPGVQFGGGPTVFQFGGGMPRVRRTGSGPWAQNMNGHRAQQSSRDGDQPIRNPAGWITFLPIIIFFVISLLQSLPSLFSTPPTPDPTFSWTPNAVYPVERVTHTPSGIKYFVNPTEFGTHPFYEAYLTANPKLGFNPPLATDSADAPKALRQGLVNFLPVESASLVGRSRVERQRLKLPSAFRKFEQGVENAWVRKLQSECHYAREIRDSKKRNAMGFLGIGADWEAIRKLDAERIPSCDGLRDLGYVLD